MRPRLADKPACPPTDSFIWTPDDGATDRRAGLPVSARRLDSKSPTAKFDDRDAAARGRLVREHLKLGRHDVSHESRTKKSHLLLHQSDHGILDRLRERRRAERRHGRQQQAVRDRPTELRLRRKGGIVVNWMLVAGQRGKLGKMLRSSARSPRRGRQTPRRDHRRKAACARGMSRSSQSVGHATPLRTQDCMPEYCASLSRMRV